MLRSLWFTLCLTVVPLSARAQVPLSERDVVEGVLERNPSLRASVSDRAAARAGVRIAEGGRTPTFTASATASHGETITNTAAGVAGTAQDRIGFTTGLAYTTAWGLAVTFDIAGGVGWREVNRDPSTTLLFRIGPNYDTSMTLGLRQPLLRGAGEESVLGAVREAEATRRAADHTLDAALSTLLSDALTAHWDLWYASRALEVQESALALGAQQVAEAELRLHELGTVPRTEVLRLSAELARIRRALASAEGALATNAITVGQAIGVDAEASEPLRALPEVPELTPPLSLASLVEAARVGSPELAALDADVEAARIALARAEDAAEVRLDVTGSLAAGVLFTDATLASFNLPNGRPAVTAMVGLELEVPLGPSAGEGERERARALLDAAEARLEARTNELEAEIATLRAEVSRALRDVTLAAEAADAARALAEAERQSLALGTSTAYAVVEAQQAERDAVLSHFEAIADYARARVRLEHRTGLLIERLGVDRAGLDAEAP